MPSGRPDRFATVTLAALLLVISVLSGCAWARDWFGDRTPDADQVRQVGESLKAASPEQLEQAKEFVHAVHQQMNALAGWGHLSQFRDRNSPAWEDVRKLLEGDAVHSFREAADSLQPATVGRDLLAFVQALEQAYADRNREQLRVAHRIIHDLDYWVFNHSTVAGGSRDYWGATITLEGEKSAAAAVLVEESPPGP